MVKINWDLSDLYKSTSDPKIIKDQKEIKKQTISFTKGYKTKINSTKLTSSYFLKSLVDYEKIIEKISLLGNYASFLFTINSENEKIKKFYQEIQEFYTTINTQVLWFNLEWIELDNKLANKLINNNKLAKYKHYLIQTRALKPFILPESEEKIMTQKAQTSSDAFVRLYDQLESAEKFELKIKGKIEILNSSQIASIMKSNPDRKLRKAAIESYSNTYMKNSNLYTYILNTLVLDKKVSDEIRKANFPQELTFLGYETKKETVENMSKAVSESKKIVEKFYLAKKKLMKVDKLYEWDRYSNIFNTDEKKYSWDQAKKIVLDSFLEFSPKFHEIAKTFFNNNWVDAEIKNGKRSGAYCSYGTPNYHPMIMVNFSGKVEDITTLAHELGHGIHAYLSRGQTLLEYHPSTATAEMASTFAENLVFERLYSQITSKKEKINLMGTRIQNSFATIFRQNDFYIFETKIHELRRSKGELTQEEIGSLYQEILQKTFGRGLTLTSRHKNFWMPISHFYHYNFYVFTYVFGDLLSSSLFAKYKIEGKQFVDKYIKALSVGGSLDPYETTKIMDINLDTKDFWTNGLELIEKELEEWKKLF